MRSARVRVRAAAIGPACAIAVLLASQAGPANAATRGFKVTNESKQELRVVGGSPIPRVLCYGLDAEDFQCRQAYWPYGLEDHPEPGTALRSGETQSWELKYYYNVSDLFGIDYNYQAKVTYRVGADGKFEATIKTSNYTNDSECEVIPKRLGRCTAAGRNITFK
jgi:opacity protein-like surface antigen